MAGAGGMPVVVPFEPVILFPFNSGAADTYGWTVTPAGAGSVALIDADRDPASTTPGALRVNAVFPPYDATGTSATVTALYEYGNPTTDTNRALVGATRVHMWIRLVSPTPAASLNFFQPFVQGGAMTFYSNNFGYALADVLVDNAWHEFVLEVAGAAYITDLWRVGVALSPVTVLPLLPDAGADAAAVPEPVVLDAGADAGVGPLGSPAPVTIDIDYVWIE